MRQRRWLWGVFGIRALVFCLRIDATKLPLRQYYLGRGMIIGRDISSGGRLWAGEKIQSRAVVVRWVGRNSVRNNGSSVPFVRVCTIYEAERRARMGMYACACTRGRVVDVKASIGASPRAGDVEP
jgi:hypothetical protein